jgi:hypothetical protein
VVYPIIISWDATSSRLNRISQQDFGGCEPGPNCGGGGGDTRVDKKFLTSRVEFARIGCKQPNMIMITFAFNRNFVKLAEHIPVFLIRI